MQWKNFEKSGLPKKILVVLKNFFLKIKILFSSPKNVLFANIFLTPPKKKYTNTFTFLEVPEYFYLRRNKKCFSRDFQHFLYVFIDIGQKNSKVPQKI